MNEPQIANDDWPILIATMVDSGPNSTAVFVLLRDTLGIPPATAKAHLHSPIQIARGSRMEIETVIDRFKRAGAVVEVRVDNSN